MSDKLQQAIALIKAGDRKNGGQLFAAILKAEPDNEYAWVWMSRIVNNDEHREECLRETLRINPDNQEAKADLAALQQRNGNETVPIIAGLLAGVIIGLIVWYAPYELIWRVPFFGNYSDNIVLFGVWAYWFIARIFIAPIAGWISGYLVYKKILRQAMALGFFEIEMLSVAIFLVVSGFSCTASGFLIMSLFLMNVQSVFFYVVFFLLVLIAFYITYKLTVTIRTHLKNRFSK